MKFVTLETFDNYIDANLTMNRLEEAGINCWLNDEASVTIAPMLSNAMGGVKLMIEENDIDRSVQILHVLKEIRRKSFACPHCNSHDIEHIISNRKASNIISSVLTWMLGNYAVGVKQVWHCFRCREEFETPVELDGPGLYE